MLAFRSHTHLTSFLNIDRDKFPHEAEVASSTGGCRDGVARFEPVAGPG